MKQWHERPKRGRGGASSWGRGCMSVTSSCVRAPETRPSAGRNRAGGALRADGGPGARGNRGSLDEAGEGARWSHTHAKLKALPRAAGSTAPRIPASTPRPRRIPPAPCAADGSHITYILGHEPHEAHPSRAGERGRPAGGAARDHFVPHGGRDWRCVSRFIRDCDVPP